MLSEKNLITHFKAMTGLLTILFFVQITKQIALLMQKFDLDC